MDSQQAASMTALILNGVSKERAASRYGKDSEFSQLWDDIAADIDRQRKENPKIQFDIPNEMPDLEGIGGGDAPASPSDGDGPDAESPAEDTTEKAVADGPALSNLKKKAAPPK
jgi:hypothetical protein